MYLENFRKSQLCDYDYDFCIPSSTHESFIDCAYHDAKKIYFDINTITQSISITDIGLAETICNSIEALMQTIRMFGCDIPTVNDMVLRLMGASDALEEISEIGTLENCLNPDDFEILFSRSEEALDFVGRVIHDLEDINV